MFLRIDKTLLVSGFEVEVHKDFRHRFFRADPLVKEELVFDFGDSRAFYRRGVGDDRIKIKFVVIKLFVDAESDIFVDRIGEFCHLIHLFLRQNPPHYTQKFKKLFYFPCDFADFFQTLCSS